jgi:hypothetical protein
VILVALIISLLLHTHTHTKKKKKKAHAPRVINKEVAGTFQEGQNFRTSLLLEYMPEKRTRQPHFLLWNYFLVKSEDMELNNTTTTTAPDSPIVTTMRTETTIDRQGPRIVAETMGQPEES